MQENAILCDDIMQAMNDIGKHRQLCMIHYR